MGAATLTTDQMPSHSHTLGVSGSGTGTANSGVPASAVGDASIDYGTEITGGGQSHTHGLSGVSSSNANSLPPYYVLSYIMRTA